MDIKNLRITLDSIEILKGISCTFKQGAITSCIGRSGAGKTTLLKTLAGLIKPSSGSIEIDNSSIENMTPMQRAQKIGFVFQDFNLFAHMNVLQNCIDPLLIQGITPKEATERACKILAQLGIAEKADAYPRELSGGQQQRVAIARALCLQPNVLIMDEPTASLDPENSSILVNLLRNLSREGLTIILSTQDMSFAQAVSDSILFMQSGEIVEQCEKPTICKECVSITFFLQTRLTE
jgi:ABC-type polar amino acid transport system ATPase subunit